MILNAAMAIGAVQADSGMDIAEAAGGTRGRGGMAESAGISPSPTEIVGVKPVDRCRKIEPGLVAFGSEQ